MNFCWNFNKNNYFATVSVSFCFVVMLPKQQPYWCGFFIFKREFWHKFRKNKNEYELTASFSSLAGTTATKQQAGTSLELEKHKMSGLRTTAAAVLK